MNRFFLFLVISSIVLFSSCGDDNSSSCSDGVKNGTETGVDIGGDCEFSFFGLYTGEMVATDKYGGPNPESVTDSNVSINITDCDADCFEVTFQHNEGFTKTAGTFTKNGSIYSLDIVAVEEPGDIGQPWAAENGVGTFDAANNNLRMTFEVSDYSGLLGTDHVATIEASRD